jgi:nitrogen PTS system EIIA component
MRSILNALQEGRLFELPDVNKARALEFLARILDANPDIEVGTDTIELIKQREEECNTGIGMGVGVPHVRARREEGELFCAIGWSQPGIEYGAADGKNVHLVFMYYIPGALKNVYLKEISTLVKAIKKSGGIDPIAHAPDLNGVRNHLLDWVSAVLGEAGPESVARMIKLEVRQAQGTVSLAPLSSQDAPASTGRKSTRVIPFSVLVSGQTGHIVLANDAEWVAAMEKDNGLVQRLCAGASFLAGASEIFVTGTTVYSGGRTLYHGVAVQVSG